MPLSVVTLGFGVQIHWLKGYILRSPGIHTRRYQAQGYKGQLFECSVFGEVRTAFNLGWPLVYSNIFHH